MPFIETPDDIEQPPRLAGYNDYRSWPIREKTEEEWIPAKTHDYNEASGFQDEAIHSYDETKDSDGDDLALKLIGNTEALGSHDGLYNQALNSRDHEISTSSNQVETPKPYNDDQVHHSLEGLPENIQMLLKDNPNIKVHRYTIPAEEPVITIKGKAFAISTTLQASTSTLSASTWTTTSTSMSTTTSAAILVAVPSSTPTLSTTPTSSLATIPTPTHGLTSILSSSTNLVPVLHLASTASPTFTETVTKSVPVVPSVVRTHPAVLAMVEFPISANSTVVKVVSLKTETSSFISTTQVPAAIAIVEYIEPSISTFTEVTTLGTSTLIPSGAVFEAYTTPPLRSTTAIPEPTGTIRQDRRGPMRYPAGVWLEDAEDPDPAFRKPSPPAAFAHPKSTSKSRQKKASKPTPYRPLTIDDDDSIIWPQVTAIYPHPFLPPLPPQPTPARKRKASKKAKQPSWSDSEYLEYYPYYPYLKRRDLTPDLGTMIVGNVSQILMNTR